jgi:hypothetical protein
MPSVLIVRYLPLHLLQVCWALAGRLRRGLLLPHIKGKLAFLAGLGRTMAKRRIVQSRRRVSPAHLAQLLDKHPFRKILKEHWARLRSSAPGPREVL